MKTLLLASLFISLSSHAAIFGVDDRKELNPKDPAFQLGKSTAVAVLTGNYELNAQGNINLRPDEMYNMCSSGERFPKNPTLFMACTGFLVGDNLLATAGHCVNYKGGEISNESEGYCKVFDWMFDYYRDENGNVPKDNIPAKNLYHCKRIIFAALDEEAPFRDFALIELDRKVEGRAPLKLTSGGVKATDRLSMTGYPFGMPLMLSQNARLLLNNPNRQSFITTLDAFEGNSGSPVFNQRNEVTGILIAGTPSENTYTDPKLKCDRYNRCDEIAKNCSVPDKDPSIFKGFQTTGSEVQRIDPILQLLK